MVKESKGIQELGPKKYYEKIKKENDFYDKYKAGKRDPKTGEYYHKIDFKDPRKKNYLGKTAGAVACVYCDNWFEVSTSTTAVICSNCRKLNFIKYNRDEDSIEVSK
jgi:hypothetical protein